MILFAEGSGTGRQDDAGRGQAERQAVQLFGLEARVPAQHPLCAIRGIANEALAGLSAKVQALYSHTGRPGIAPEWLPRAL
jgi:hypothetical protein